jgi:predicted nucleic acid-binding protein
MYLDSAYIAKFYLNEPDSQTVRDLIQGALTRISSEWSVVEVTAAFHRHVREGHLTGGQYRELVQVFHAHLDAEVWTLMPLNGRLIRRLSAAMRSLPDDVSLRSGDAIQLF